MSVSMLSPETIEWLPTVNASLNGLAAILLTCGWIFIKKQRKIAHRNCMIAAFAVSTLFLTSYLIYHFHHVSTPFPGSGVWRLIYFAVLIPHILLAASMLPMIFLSFLRAFKADYVRHVRVSRKTLPIWIYVSVTGVVVYVMLYHVDWSV